MPGEQGRENNERRGWGDKSSYSKYLEKHWKRSGRKNNSAWIPEKKERMQPAE
jgi:hypothetical protein